MSRSDIEIIKNKISIVDLISSYIKLDKKGRYYKAPCPFHTEKTASFTVTPEREIFHCFGCGKGGDIFAFLQEMEGLSFYETLQTLAQRAGVVLSSSLQDTENSSEKKQLYEVLDQATKFYEIQLRTNKNVVQYLLDRGLSKETMVAFRIGFAPEGWDTLYQYLKRKGYHDHILDKVGLITQGDRGKRDWFRDRIIFPITDSQGRVVAFTGRIFLHPHEQLHPPEHKKNTGKYINSRETLLYQKSKILFAYDKAKRAMMTQDCCLVVEGQMDAIMVHQAGVTNTIALSGTALTEDQLKMIRRFTDYVIYAFDNDKAGHEALRRSAKNAYQADMRVSVVMLETEKDPAEFIQVHGIDAWKKRVQDAVDYVDFEINYMKNTYHHDRDRMKHMHDVLFPALASLSSLVLRDMYLEKIARSGNYQIDSVRNDFENFFKKIVPRVSTELLVQKPTETKPQTIDGIMKEILGMIWFQESIASTLAPVFSREVEKILQQFSDISVEKESFDEYRENLVFLAQIRYDGLSEEKLSQEYNFLLRQLHISLLQERKRILLRNIQQAEQEGKETSSEQYLQEYHQLLKIIDDLHAINGKDV